MKSPLPVYLNEVLTQCQDTKGAPASYIPELAQVDPNKAAVALSTIDGTVYAAGDSKVEFAIESISKAFVYALALEDRGFTAVDKKLSVEPSGDAFNQLSLDPKTGRPDNALINAGAITAHTLVGPVGMTPQKRYDRVAEMLSKCAGRTLRVMEDVYSSEMKTADRNRALAYMLHSTGIIEGDPMEAVKYYTRQCSLAVTCEDLAVMVATLANHGVQPVTKEKLFSPDVVVRVLSVMLTCGMYDFAGDWVTSVGIPSKSGVGGGIIGGLPGQLGLATFSPRLDSHGNSERGIDMFQHMSRHMGLHIMSFAPPAHSAIRRDHTINLRHFKSSKYPAKLRVVSVQGAVNFVAAEAVAKRLETIKKTDDVGLVLDLRTVTGMYKVGVLLLTKCVQQLLADGHKVGLIDPDGLLPKDQVAGADRPKTLTELLPESLRPKDDQLAEY